MDKYTDIVVININNGKEYKLHKFILGQISYFDKMFSGGYMEEKMEKIEVEFNPESWEKIIRYMYIPFEKNYNKLGKSIKYDSFGETTRGYSYWNYEDYGLADMLGMDNLANQINNSVCDYFMSKCFEYYNIKDRHLDREEYFIRILDSTEELAKKHFLARKMISENWQFREFTNVLGSFLLDFLIRYPNIEKYKYSVITFSFLNKNFIPLCGNILLESLSSLTEGEKYSLGLISYDIQEYDIQECDNIEVSNIEKRSNYEKLQDAIKLDNEGHKSVSVYFKQQQKLDYPNRDFIAYFLVKYHFPRKCDIFPISRLVDLNLLYLLPLLMIRYSDFAYPKNKFHHLLISTIIEQCSYCPHRKCSYSICPNYSLPVPKNLFEDKEYCIKLIIINIADCSKLPFHEYLSKVIVLGDTYYSLTRLFYNILVIQNNSYNNLLHTYENLLSSSFDLKTGLSLNSPCSNYADRYLNSCNCKCRSHKIHQILDLIRKHEYLRYSLTDLLR